MAETLHPEQFVQHQVEETITTSVSNLYFTEDHVYKTWLHHHGLIDDLEFFPVRVGYLEGEERKGKIINYGYVQQVYEGIVALKYDRDEGGDVVGFEEIELNALNPRLQAKELEDWDFALKMKRFPKERRMDKMLKAGTLKPQHIADAVHRIIDQYDRFSRLEEDYAQALATDIDNIIADTFSFDYMQNVLGVILDRDKVGLIEVGTRTFLTEHKPDLQRALQDGSIKYSHGDTKILNIYVGDGEVGDKDKCYILDAISFKDEWCLNDLLSDLAYFAIYFDVEKYLDFPQNLEVIDEAYKQRTGSDLGLQENPMFWFYLNYRAMVQAKVAAIEAVNAETEGKDALDKQDEAEELMSLGAFYLAKALSGLPEKIDLVVKLMSIRIDYLAKK
ncbi:hypothetical protein ACFLZ1_01860 [Patescibacteria group bacterium]